MYVTVVQPSSADGNTDNKTDRFVTNHGVNDTVVLLNTNDSMFTTQKTYNTAGKASCLAAAASNGDSKLDIRVTNCNSKSMSVVPSNGGTGNVSSSTHRVPDIPKWCGCLGERQKSDPFRFRYNNNHCRLLDDASSDDAIGAMSVCLNFSRR